MSLFEFRQAALLFPLALCRLLQPVLLAPCGFSFQPLTFRLPLSRFRLLFRMPLFEFRQAALLFSLALCRLLQPVLLAPCGLGFQPLKLRLPLRRFLRMSLLEFGQAALLRLVRLGAFPLALCRLLQPVLLAPCGLSFQTLTFRLPLSLFL